MKTDDELLKEVLLYVTNQAKVKTENHEHTILTGNRLNHIEMSKAQEYLRIMGYIISEMVRQVQNAYSQDAYEDTIYHARKLFRYIFDKTLETFYSTLIEEEPEVLLNIEEALDDEYYEISIPERLQLKVIEVVPNIIGIGGETYQFLKDNGYLELPLSKWLYFYLCAASSLAQQFLLEQDLEK